MEGVQSDIRLSLEILGQSLTVDKHVTSDDADSGALSEDVQQGCLNTELSEIERENKDKEFTFPAPDSPIRAVNFPGAT